MQDDSTAGDWEILDLARVGAVEASRTSVALRTLGRRGYPAQSDVHRVVDTEHTLDAQTSQMGHWHRDAQGHLQQAHALLRAPVSSITSPGPPAPKVKQPRS